MKYCMSMSHREKQCNVNFLLPNKSSLCTCTILRDIWKYCPFKFTLRKLSQVAVFDKFTSRWLQTLASRTWTARKLRKFNIVVWECCSAHSWHISHNFQVLVMLLEICCVWRRCKDKMTPKPLEPRVTFCRQQRQADGRDGMWHHKRCSLWASVPPGCQFDNLWLNCGTTCVQYLQCVLYWDHNNQPDKNSSVWKFNRAIGTELWLPGSGVISGM